MIIEVTSEHITMGRRGNHKGSCPLGHALRTAFGTDRVTVWPSIAFVENRIIFLPPEAEKFSVDWDRGVVVKGFSFTLPDMP